MSIRDNASHGRKPDVLADVVSETAVPRVAPRVAVPRDRVGRYRLEVAGEIGAQLKYRSDHEILDFLICAVYLQE